MKQSLSIILFIMPLALFINGVALKAQENVARGKSCKVFSSLESKNWSVSRLTDGEKGDIGWSSKAFSTYSEHILYPEYVVIDLGSTYNLNKISLFPRGDGASAGKGFPEDFNIQLCQQGEPWRVVVQKKNYPAPLNGNPQEFLLTPTKARFIKIEASRLRVVDGNNFYFQLAEVEAFGKETKATPLDTSQNPEIKETNSIQNLRCENEENPIGMDVYHPRFSWWLTSTGRGVLQKSYQVLVSSSEMDLQSGKGDMWDSEEIESDNSIGVKYDGKPLQSGKQYWWKVKVISNAGKDFGWSQPATFSTGRMSQNDWQGKWIGATADNKHGAVYLRKEIEIQKPVKRAIVYFCGLGYSELSIEGEKVGDYFLSPGFTSYDKRTQYVAYDVTKALSTQGRKALAVTLVDGWYNLVKDPWGHEFHKRGYIDKPKMLFDLLIEYKDGTEASISSDENWKWSFGEIIRSWVSEEDIDLRKSNPGWDKSGYTENNWKPAKVVNGPTGMLIRQKEDPCRIIREIYPVSMKYIDSTKTYLFDFQSELTGVVHFCTKGEKSTSITVTTIPIDKNYPHSSIFILAGNNRDETYEPRFFNIGIKQVAIKGLTQTPKLRDVSVRVISNGWKKNGDFSCSDGLINSLEDIVRKTSEYYTSFLPLDPTREWKAWTQDIESMFLSNTYLFDAQRLYERWQLDMMNDQRADGNVPNISPGPFFDDYNSPWWGGCVVWLPWNLYQYFGDESFLKESYPEMKRYVDFLSSQTKYFQKAFAPPLKPYYAEYLSSKTKDGLQNWGLTDWCPIEETPRPLINTPAYYLFCTIVSKSALLLGKVEESQFYANVALKIKTTFNDTYLDKPTGIYGEPDWQATSGNTLSTLKGIVPHQIWWTGDRVPTQAGQALALATGLVPENERASVEKALVKEVEAHGNHLSTGFCSTPYLLKVLADVDPELGWEVTTKQDYPSWYSNTIGSDNYLMKEMWHGGQVLMPSLAGNIAGWIYESIAGIRPDAPGFKKIVIKPNFAGNLHWVNSSFNTVYGKIVCNWQKRENLLIMKITIPANTTATVYVPTTLNESVKENNQTLSQSKNVNFIRMENGYAVLLVGSGQYRFTSKL